LSECAHCSLLDKEFTVADKILKVVKVEEQKQGSVLISIPMVGFPDGFQLRPGESVTLVEETSGRLAVRPLVRATVATGRGKDGGSESFVVFTTDEAGPPNVVATRPSR
jgi:hypothetical protein